MKAIPIAAAKRIAEEYGYDQVVIVARCTDHEKPPGTKTGEHCTTYGVTKAHCDVAARIGEFFTQRLMGWKATS